MKEDFVGQEVTVGDIVVAATGFGHELTMYEVIAMTPKMVRVRMLGAKTPKTKKGALRYSKELVKVNEEIATFHILKTTGTI